MTCAIKRMGGASRNAAKRAYPQLGRDAATTALALVAASLVGCSSSNFCDVCPERLSLFVVLQKAGEGPVTVDHEKIRCSSQSSERWHCFASEHQLEAGEHTIVVSAPGYREQMVTFTIPPPSAGRAGCPDCPGFYHGEIELVADEGMPEGGGAAR